VSRFPVRAFISDLDGTLADTQSANIAAYDDAFTENGVPFNRAAYEGLFGIGFPEMMDAIAPDTDATTRLAIARSKQLAYRDHLHLVRPHHALLDLLRTVRASGHPVGLATTASRANALLVVEHLGIRDLFDVAVFREDVTRSKPDPAVYLESTRRIGLAPSQCLVFEDSEVGELAARTAGCPVVRVAM
jgi:beta-phosphoglucomutase